MNPIVDIAYNDRDFRQIQILFKDLSGIELKNAKKHMAFNRLSRHLREKGIASFEHYLQLVKHNKTEQERFVNALTTNLTGFFREAHHFNALNQFLEYKKGPLTIWSAACSTGEEPYSALITACQARDTFAPKVKVMATDINSEVLDIAKKGVYSLDKLNKVPFNIREKYFLKGTKKNRGYARIKPQLQDMVQFKQFNLASKQWDLPTRFDVIFCRNVLIYFQPEETQQIVNNMLQHLRKDGLFFAGHAENYTDFNHVLEPLGDTIYRKR